MKIKKEKLLNEWDNQIVYILLVNLKNVIVICAICVNQSVNCFLKDSYLSYMPVIEQSWAC